MTALSVAMVGMVRTFPMAAGRNNYILVFRGVKIEAGFINHETLDILRVRPEIALDASGKPLISPEILGAFDPTPDAPRASTAALRAIKDVGYEVHNKIRVIEGRRPERGKNEWIVGQRLLVRFPLLPGGAKTAL